jgi:hypothetical protein
MNRISRNPSTKEEMKMEKHYELGELTIVREGDGWIVLENGRRVGGTLREPFTSKAAAKRWVARERSEQAKIKARGDVGTLAVCKIIRGTDPELWWRIDEIEKKFDDEEEHERAHTAAGTWGVMIQLSMASLEAEGQIIRTGEIRDGQPVFVAKEFYHGRN